MSNREALRDLQSRLAQRLQAARVQPVAASWLAFECEGQGFVVALEGAGELFSYAQPTALAHTQPWFLGVANLRGSLHGVVDFAAFLGLRAARVPAEGPQRDASRVLALSAGGSTHCALLIDRLAGLRSPAQMRALDDVEGAARPAFALGAWADDAGHRWQQLDLAALVADEHFLAAAA